MHASLVDAMPTIQEAMKAGDLKVLQAELHRLKGEVAYCNQPTLLGVVTIFYQQVMTDDVSMLQPCYEAFVSEATQVLNELEETLMT